MRFVIVGAGPAGMAAALTLADQGIRPVVVDAQRKSGGQIWRGKATSPLHHLFNQMVESDHIILRSDSAVIDSAPGVLVTSRGRVSWDRLILATGARELFLPFPGWTEPGVMGVGGLQAALKSGLQVSGRRIVIGGSGPLLVAVGAALMDAGAQVLCICEQAPMSRVAWFGIQTALEFGKLGQAIFLAQKTARCFRTGQWITDITRTDSLQVHLNTGQTLQADYVGVGYGLVPNLELPRLLGCAVKNGFVWADANQQTSQANIWTAGESTGIGGVDSALAEGRLAALSSMEMDVEQRRRAAEKWRAYQSLLAEAYRLRPEVKSLALPETIVCRCEGIACGQVGDARDATEVKLDHRLGMGWCQGRICGAACRELFGWSEASVRPPLFPINASQYANLLNEHES